MPSSYEIIKDPIYGYIKLYPHEERIINLPIFQRLRRIKQLTAVEFVYPAATHTRFSHSIGVMHVAGEFTKRLLEQIKMKEQKRKYYYYFMRLWGLLHDIGHGPFSHTFDEIILAKHGLNHEGLGGRIIREVIASDFPESVIKTEDNSEINLEDLAIVVGSAPEEPPEKVEEGKRPWPLDEKLGEEHNAKLLEHVMRGFYSADIFDFLLRDSYFTGARYGHIDWQRLIYLSIPSGNRIVLNKKAEIAFDNFLLARLFMFDTVYYHRIVRAMAKVIELMLKEYDEKIGGIFSNYIDGNELLKYKDLDEEYILNAPELIDSGYKQMLKERKNPYSREGEIPLSITSTERSSLMPLDRQARMMEKEIREELSLGREVFFIDTPYLELNPRRYEKTVYFYDPVDRNIEERNIFNTNWGNLSATTFVVRLYVKKGLNKDIVSKIKEKFNELRTPISSKAKEAYM